LHTGAYQLPIFYDEPSAADFVSYKDYVQLERIPTASVFIRVDYASIDEDGNFITQKTNSLAFEKAPEYNSGAYCTLYYLISDQEKDLYGIRSQRKHDLPLREVMRLTASSLGYKPD
jgi:hypothetical protein